MLCRVVPGGFQQGAGPLQKPFLLRGTPSCSALAPSAIRGSPVPGLLHLECVTLQSLRQCPGLARFEDGVWHHGVSAGAPAAQNTEVDPSHILQHKCPKEERASLLCFNTQNRTLYMFCFKYSFHGLQQKLHITTLKNPNPFCKRELKWVLCNTLNKPHDETSGLDFCPKSIWTRFSACQPENLRLQMST